MGWPFFNLFGKGDAAYYFLRSCSFMPVVPAILTRNKRLCSRFRKSVFGLLIIVLIVLQKLCAVKSQM